MSDTDRLPMQPEGAPRGRARICIWAKKGQEIRCVSCDGLRPKTDELQACRAYTAAAAQEAGCLFYRLPEELEIQEVDLLLQQAVLAINRTGVCWTAESCQGHPESTDPCWASNVEPMLRLAYRTKDEAQVMGCLLRATRSVENQDRQAGTLRLSPDPRGQPDWCELLVYVIGTTAYDRNRGIAIFDRFASLLGQ